MERLTKPAVNKTGRDYVSAIGSGFGAWPRIIQRLAEYENTGMTPEEIIENMAMFHSYRHVCAGVSPNTIETVTMAMKNIGKYLVWNNGTGYDRIFHIHGVYIAHDMVRYELGDFCPGVKSCNIRQIIPEEEAKAMLKEADND